MKYFVSASSATINVAVGLSNCAASVATGSLVMTVSPNSCPSRKISTNIPRSSWVIETSTAQGTRPKRESPLSVGGKVCAFVWPSLGNIGTDLYVLSSITNYLAQPFVACRVRAFQSAFLLFLPPYLRKTLFQRDKLIYPGFWSRRPNP